MKALRIVSKNIPNNWWCKSCAKSMNAVIKVDEKSFCDLCVPEQFKDKLINVNQSRKIL